MISSEEERFPDTEEVTSSILVSPTMIFEEHPSGCSFFVSLKDVLIFIFDDNNINA